MKATLYTSERCHYCIEVEEFLADNKVKIDIVRKDIDIPSGAMELNSRAGRVGVPTMIVGDEILVGSNVIIDWLKTNIKRSK